MTANEESFIGRVSPSHRVATFLAVIAPLMSLVVAIILAWGWAVAVRDIILMLVMYLVAGLGITLGFHRLFSHRSFLATRPVKIGLAIMGSMAIQGTLFRWVATHRRHHQHSDQDEDPHSPHRYGKGFWPAIRGCLHAHVGWIFRDDPPGLDRYVADLVKDRDLCMVNRLFPLWVALSLLLPAVLGAVISGSWVGGLLGFLWGGLVRTFLVHHVTWSVNSICHVWGSRPHATRDQSRNNLICGILAFGEGWHNNHHAFPASARHGLSWWQFDLSYIVLTVLRWFRLVRDVRLPESHGRRPRR